MTFFVEEPTLEPGGSLAWRATANRSHDGLAVGGRLFVTDRRIVFHPTGLEQQLGREQWQCPFQDVLAVDLAERELNLFSGGLRRRVRIRTKTSTALFIVWRPRKFVDQLQDIVTNH